MTLVLRQSCDCRGRRPMTNGRSLWKTWRIASFLCFVTSLLQFWYLLCCGTLVCARTLVLGVLRATLWLGGGRQQELEGQMRKVSSILACRQGRCRRHLRLGRAVISRGRAAGIFPARGTSSRLNAQLPLPIASSAASASEQAFSRELLLGLTRDTVLAAVPWLRFSPKARH